jgi:hypothetical protein
MTDKLFILGTPLVAMAANIAADAISPETHISIGTALAVGGVVVGACWWLATKFKGIDDQLSSIEHHLRSLPCEGKGCNKKHVDE